MNTEIVTKRVHPNYCFKLLESYIVFLGAGSRNNRAAVNCKTFFLHESSVMAVQRTLGTIQDGGRLENVNVFLQAES